MGYQTATSFAKRVSGASAAIKDAQQAKGRSRAENAAKREYGALRGAFEHESFDTAARRHQSQSSIGLRRYANTVLVFTYAVAAGLLYGAYCLLHPLQ